MGDIPCFTLQQRTALLLKAPFLLAEQKFFTVLQIDGADVFGQKCRGEGTARQPGDQQQQFLPVAKAVQHKRERLFEPSLYIADQRMTVPDLLLKFRPQGVKSCHILAKTLLLQKDLVPAERFNYPFLSVTRRPFEQPGADLDLMAFLTLMTELGQRYGCWFRPAVSELSEGLMERGRSAVGSRVTTEARR